MSIFVCRIIAAIAATAAVFGSAFACPAPVMHFAPAENLEQIDVRLMDAAQHEIDLAAFVLTDGGIMQALGRASDRGVQVRIYLEAKNLGKTIYTKHFQSLAENQKVKIRLKSSDPFLMHLKGYQIDGTLLRTGAANFSVSGLKDQDNDLIVIQCEETVAAFKNNYDSLFERGINIGDVSTAKVNQ